MNNFNWSLFAQYNIQSLITTSEYNIHEYNKILGYLQLINEYNVDIIILRKVDYRFE